MASQEDKPYAHHVEVAENDAPSETKVTAVHSVALTNALVKDKHSPWTSSMLKLYGIMVLVTLSEFSVLGPSIERSLTEIDDCMNGYDGSLMSSINAMDPYHKFFHVGMQGSGTGIIFAIYPVGNIVGSFMAGSFIDYFGRRLGMFSGSVFITIGTIIQATAPNIGQFMGGRFLVGFGVVVAVTAAPVYLVEMAFPSWRGIFGGLYNVCGYYIGALGLLSTNVSLVFC